MLFRSGEFDEDGRRVRGRRRRRWRRCRASGGLWIGGEEEGVEAELPGASVRRVEHGGCGNRRRWRRLRSVAGGETEERGGGRSRGEGEGRGGRGCVASREGPGKEEAARQGGGGLLGRACASTQLLPLARGRRQGGVAVVGWAALGRSCWATRWASQVSRQVCALCSVLLFCFLLLITFAIVLNLNKFKQCQKLL